MYLGGANGISIIKQYSSGSGGSGGAYAWQKDNFETFDTQVPPVTYVRFLLGFTPVSAFAVNVWWNGQILHFSDWVLEDIGDGPQIRLLFPFDPSTGTDGTKNIIEVTYPFAI